MRPDAFAAVMATGIVSIAAEDHGYHRISDVLAVLAAAGLAIVSAVIVYRYLPHTLAAEGSLHGPVESIEDAAELGLGGTPPVFADE